MWGFAAWYNKRTDIYQRLTLDRWHWSALSCCLLIDPPSTDVFTQSAKQLILVSCVLKLGDLQDPTEHPQLTTIFWSRSLQWGSHCSLISTLDCWTFAATASSLNPNLLFDRVVQKIWIRRWNKRSTHMLMPHLPWTGSPKWYSCGYHLKACLLPKVCLLNLGWRASFFKIELSSNTVHKPPYECSAKKK